MKSSNRRSVRIAFFAALFAIIQLCTAMPAFGDPPATSSRKIAEGKPLMTIGEMAVGAPVTCFALAPAGDIVALGGDDGKIRFWSLTSGKVVRTIVPSKERQCVGGIAFSPDGKRLVFQADDHPARLWDLEKDVEVAGLDHLTIYCESHSALYVYGSRWSRDVIALARGSGCMKPTDVPPST